MSSSSANKQAKTYASSVTSTSTSSTAASYTKPSSTPSSSSRRTAIKNAAKRLLADIGRPPTAAYDREQAAKGEMTDSQSAFYMPNQMARRT